MSIEEMLLAGKTTKEIAKAEGIGLSTVYYQIHKLNLKKPTDFKEYKGKHDEEIIKYRKLGLSYPDIARRLGDVDRQYVRRRCESLKLEYTHEEKSYDGYIHRLQCQGFEYISGYVNYYSIVRVKCVECGEVQEKKYKAIIGGALCDKCQAIRKEKRRQEGEQKRQEREREREQKRQEKVKQQEKAQKERLYKAAEQGVQMQFKICPVCNEIYYGREKYCSAQCRKRQKYRNKDAKRRARIRAQIVSKDISLQRLYARDKGKCYLCGDMCKWDDCEYTDNAFIAGNLYPSIDHVIPLVKGGTHSWGNVRLAHRICNSLKSDILITP